MGSIRNGQGDHYFALFNAAGCWLKGFDHEAPMSPFASGPPKVAAGVSGCVPVEFQACLAEPAFVNEETTFCLWRRYSNAAWQHGPVNFPPGEVDPDGSAGLLQYLDGRPQTYRDWAENYYERDVPLEAVRSIFAHEPFDQPLVTALNAEVSLLELSDDVDQIGYPLAARET